MSSQIITGLKLKKTNETMVPVHNNLIEITRTTANQEWDDLPHCMFDPFHLCLLDFPAEIIFNFSSEPSTRGYS